MKTLYDAILKNPWDYDSERNLKIGVYLPKLWSKIKCLVFRESVSYTNNRKRLSVPCYFLAPCDKRKHTGHAHQQAASQASTDSAWRHPVWLPHSRVGFQRPVGRRSYHNNLACAALLTLTPQATIARSAILIVLPMCNRCCFENCNQ